ncbi:MAG TPA: PilZ domain-containing protein [Thermoanaerobaculia bacterium]|nr:PilZ domain-containing protein [Thermoanaerobaculia bacterium]
MNADETNPKSFSRATRVPLEAVVRLHFEGEISYQNGFSANLSATGMFVKHPEPHPVGSRLVFECLVGQQRQPVQGIGLVVWARPRYEGPGLPAGMGIEFLEVDPRSREHLAQALFEYLEESIGGQTVTAESAAEELPAAEETPFFPAAEPFRLALEGGGPGEDEDLREEDLTASALPALEGKGWDSGPAEASPWGSYPEPSPASTAEASSDAFEASWGSAAPAPALAAPAPEEPWRAPKVTPWTPEPASWTAEPAAEGSDFEELYEFEPPARSRRGWLWGGLAALLALGLGGAAWLWWPAGSQVASQEPAAAAVAPTAEAGSPATAAEPAAPPMAQAAPAVAQATPPPMLTPPVTPEPAPAVPAARFGGVRDLRWERAGGGTEVAVLLDGSIAQGDWTFASMPGENPRLLLKLRGVSRPFRPNRVEVGTPEVRAVRFGLHAGARGEEQHLVLDLGSCDPRRATVRAEGDRLLVLCPGG